MAVSELERVKVGDELLNGNVERADEVEFGEEQIGDLQSVARHRHTHTHTHTFNGPLSGTTQVSRYQKGKTNLDFTEARDSEWQWHQLGHMQIYTSLQTNNHASTPSLSFFTGRMPFLPPNQQCQSTEGVTHAIATQLITSFISSPPGKRSRRRAYVLPSFLIFSTPGF